jgi:large subunit ribosomal protein L27e
VHHISIHHPDSISTPHPSPEQLLIVSLHFDDGEKSTNKKFGCALVVGIERPPLRVTRSMSVKKAERRSKMKPFVKLINYSHIMPTRYNFDVDFKGAATLDTLKDAKKKKEARKEIKTVLGEKYKAGQNKWFFSKLRF